MCGAGKPGVAIVQILDWVERGGGGQSSGPAAKKKGKGTHEKPRGKIRVWQIGKRTIERSDDGTGLSKGRRTENREGDRKAHPYRQGCSTSDRIKPSKPTNQPHPNQHTTQQARKPTLSPVR